MSRTPTVPGPASTRASSSAAKGIKLPKIEVPTFDGNILHWPTFWEQFEVSVHDKDSLSDAGCIYNTPSREGQPNRL